MKLWRRFETGVTHGEVTQHGKIENVRAQDGAGDE